MTVNEATEYYLLHLGLTKQQLKNMLPSEVDQYCEDVIKKRIKERIDQDEKHPKKNQ